MENLLYHSILTVIFSLSPEKMLKTLPFPVPGFFLGNSFGRKKYLFIN